ncbi:hypothetical protein [Streptomyces sp. NPDC047042]|uniref:hypothetical protein n=1 Tax=Streptomyces sp. NPDC047042 TaxID=3154807 RepID=UPI0033DAE2A3
MIDVDETSLTALARNHWLLAKAVMCGMAVPVPVGGAFGEFGVEVIHAAFGEVAAEEGDPFVVHLSW